MPPQHRFWTCLTNLKVHIKCKPSQPRTLELQSLDIAIKLWRQGSTACRCYFQLRAIGQLAAGRARLDKAQHSLQRSHGPSGARMRRLHGNFCPELAMCVRGSCLHLRSWSCHSPCHTYSTAMVTVVVAHAHTHIHTHDKAPSCTRAHAYTQDSCSITP